MARLAFLLCNVLSVLGIDTSNYIGLSIQKDNSLVELGTKADVKLVRVGNKKAVFEGDLDFEGKLSVKDLTLNGQDLVHLLKTMQAKIDVLTAKLTPPCVTNGIGGGRLEAGPKKGTKVPKGTKCTGYYMGKQHKDICEGVGYGGRGWCGVEAPPGKAGKYTSKDGAWGGCVKECPRGLARCECPNGKPLTGPACNEHGAPGCESCKPLYKLSSDKKSCEAICVTNGVGGGKTSSGVKIPKGTPCTGWYKGKQHKDVCEGTAYGGKGWCGVEAPAGQSGKYTAKDSAWGGCVKECPKGGVAQCTCPNGTPLKGPECNEHGTPGCKSCKAPFYKLNADNTACIAICVTNGVGGGKTSSGVKIPKGTPCTGWYQGKQHKDVCEGTAYGGKGWCGVESPPGKSGKYAAKDSAWGGCSKECPKGGVATCTCPNGEPLRGEECNEHGTPGCKSCNPLFSLSSDKKSCKASCVTNGVGGGKTKTGAKVPKGTPCTGWYNGKKHTDFCVGTGYGGRGWCGVEAPAGQSGKYTSKDVAWGGCSKECPKGYKP